MGEPTWKQAERRIARLLGGQRNPLSGIRGGARTHGDVIHPGVYAEVKHVKRAAIHPLMAETRKRGSAEGKLPILFISKKGTPQVAVIMDLRDWQLLWALVSDIAYMRRSASDIWKTANEIYGKGA